MDKLLRRPGPFTDPDWEPGELVTSSLETLRVLVMSVISIRAPNTGLTRIVVPVD